MGRIRAAPVPERLGLTSGDTIIELNTKNIASATDLERALFTLSSGSCLSLVFLRGNKKMASQGIY